MSKVGLISRYVPTKRLLCVIWHVPLQKFSDVKISRRNCTIWGFGILVPDCEILGPRSHLCYGGR